MNYQSLAFAAFTAAALLLYYVLPPRCQKCVLLAANAVFYALAGLEYIPFLLVTMLSTFFGAKEIGAIYEQETALLAGCKEPSEKKIIRAQCKKRARRILWAVFGAALGLLAICKYTMFVLGNINALVSVGFIDDISLIVPLGISFYTFMSIGYILDIYWKRYKAESSLLNYAVFLSYFPHVVQGPIGRYNRFREQMPGERAIAFNSGTIVRGAQLALWGLFKKLVIADRIGIFVSGVFDSCAEQQGIILFIATVVYSVQIYADFSGCIDIVTGVSEMFGITLAKNFNHPYFSKTMPEFWRRWHISLGEWFKDYVYYPVSVSRLVKNVKKNSRSKQTGELFASCFPVFVVWMATGIWHGASWNYIVWGLYHAALIITGILCTGINSRIVERLHINTSGKFWGIWQMVRTFLLCCIGRIFFRTPDLATACVFIRNMLAAPGLERIFSYNLFSYGLNAYFLLSSAIFVILLWAVDILQERMSLRDKLSQQHIAIRWAVTFIGIFAIIIFGVYGPGYSASSFIYEQF